jgi:HlyD family secretion protein
MKKYFIIGGVVLVLAVFVIFHLSSGPKRIEVQTEKVFVADITQKVTGNGKIYPVTEVGISAKVSGEILALNATEGDSVKAGEVLVRLDGEQYKAMRDRAESLILGSKAEVKLAEKELERANELFNKKLLSQAELEIAEAKYESACSQFQQAEASFNEAKDALDKTTLRSPMNGVVIKKNKEVGEMALGSQFQEDVILGIADLSKMEARIEVNENDIINVSIRDSCEIEIDAFRDTTFSGIVSEISHSATTVGSGTIEEVTNYEVRILLLEKLPSFRPGMSATADISTQTEKNVLNIPIQCLTARDRKTLEERNKVESTPADREANEESNYSKKKNKKSREDLVEIVFVVEEGVVKSRPVKIGISDENYYQVKEGLQEGEEIVTGPFKILSRTLKDGDLVRVENKKEPSEKREKK